MCHLIFSILTSDNKLFRNNCMTMLWKRTISIYNYVSYNSKYRLLKVIVFFAIAILLRIIFGDKKNVQQSCECLDSHGKQHSFCYILREENSIMGKPFSCHHILKLEQLGLIGNETYFKISEEYQPVFVTAISQSHYLEGRRLISSVQKYMRTSKIVVYDLGLSKHDAQKIKSLHNVEYRMFPFNQYAPFFRILSVFRWKPIVIAETLRDFGLIWYMDSSVILKKRDLRHVYALISCQKKEKISVKPRQKRSLSSEDQSWDKILWTANIKECNKSTYLLHSFTGHGIYAATDWRTYDYFPSNIKKLKSQKAKMYEAGLVLASRTRETQEKIMKWYVLCALEEDCMSTHIVPNICHFNKTNVYSSFAHCHRFDQSVVNVLLANAYYYDKHYYSSEISDFFAIKRYSTIIPMLEQFCMYCIALLEMIMR